MKHLILSVAALFAVACTAPAEAPAAEAAPAPEKLHNNITEAEIIDGWELMFDGQCTGNFRKYGDTVIGKAWVIDDTIEHEAVNQGSGSRVMLVFDIPRPDISDEEHRGIVALLEGVDAFSGQPPGWEI